MELLRNTMLISDLIYRILYSLYSYFDLAQGIVWSRCFIFLDMKSAEIARSIGQIRIFPLVLTIP